MAGKPHKLTLYERAVQSPVAAVDLLLAMYTHHRQGRLPGRLREDFAGSAAIARAWVQVGGGFQAWAVEHHGPTVRWAQRRAKSELSSEVDRLVLIHDDVATASTPRVDVIAAMNFSALIHHEPFTMLTYLKQARGNLRRGGIFVMDLFGGPGAMRCGEQWRTLPAEDDQPSIRYGWQQKSFDPLTHRIDCRIHFEMPDGSQRRNVFRYDWRLWSLPTLRELMYQAGFGEVAVWADAYDAADGLSDGVYQPVSKMAAREDWVVYVVGLK